MYLVKHGTETHLKRDLLFADTLCGLSYKHIGHYTGSFNCVPAEELTCFVCLAKGAALANEVRSN